MSEVYICPHCRAQSYSYYHAVTPGIVNALVKFRRAVIAKDTNSVHTRKDMDGTPNELSKGEYGNWTMLRYHGLVAKDRPAGRGYQNESGSTYFRAKSIRPPWPCRALPLDRPLDHV